MLPRVAALRGAARDIEEREKPFATLLAVIDTTPAARAIPFPIDLPSANNR
jgi:hypothetical protein